MPDSRDPNEKNLYQFYYRNKKELEKNESLDTVKLELKKLIEQYGGSSRASKYSLKDLFNFISENQRMPDSRDSNEKNLYQFYYRNKKDYRLGKMNKASITEFKRFLIKMKTLNNEKNTWESKLLYWSKFKKKGYQYSRKKDAWWKTKEL